MSRLRGRMIPRMISSKYFAGICLKHVEFALALTDAVDFFRVGDMDIRDVINTAMGMYSDIAKMKSVTGEATCDAADTSGNDVPIKWKVVDPDELG